MPIAQRPPTGLFRLATNAWTQPFWDAAARGSLVVAQCPRCGHRRMPPTPFCPRCHTQGIDWIPLSGLATVYSYTVVTRAILPEMEPHLPYVPAVIEPDDGGGVRLVSNLVGMEVDAIHVGMAVRLVWHRTADGVALPLFERL